MPLRTACYPKASLNFDGFAVLKARFTQYLRSYFTGNNITANILSVYTYPLQSSFFVAVHACDELPAFINVTSFSDSCLCQDSANTAWSSSAEFGEKTIALHNVSCDFFDLDRVEKLRLAIADGLSQYGARQADVFVTKFFCASHESHEAIRITFKVASRTTPQSVLLSELIDQSTWQHIYDSLVLKLTSASCNISPEFSIEFLPEEFVPDNSGSGQGDL